MLGFTKYIHITLNKASALAGALIVVVGFSTADSALAQSQQVPQPQSQQYPQPVGNSQPNKPGNGVLNKKGPPPQLERPQGNQSAAGIPSDSIQPETQSHTKPQQAQSDQQREINPDSLSQQDILKLQQELKNRGFYAGKIDGTWRQEISDSVREFQRSKGFDLTGWPSQAVLNSLGIQMGTQRAPASLEGDQPQADKANNKDNNEVIQPQPPGQPPTQLQSEPAGHSSGQSPGQPLGQPSGQSQDQD